MPPSRRTSKGVRSLGRSLASLKTGQLSSTRGFGERISNAKVAELQTAATTKYRLFADGTFFLLLPFRLLKNGEEEMMQAMEEISTSNDYLAPDEPIPDIQASGNEADGWETEEEGNEEVFVHCLGDEDMARREKSVRYTTKIDYRTRLIEERKQWKDQEEELTAAYMHWKAEGMYEEGDEGGDSFDCKLISLDGKSTDLRLFCIALITTQLR